MSTAYSGVKGNVLSGATDIDVQSWTLDHEINTFDSTTTADGGWDDTTPATQKISGSFDFFYNKAKYPYGALNIFPGATPTLKLFVNMTDGNFWTGAGLITKLSVKDKVKDGTVLTATFVNKGVWTVPTT